MKNLIFLISLFTAVCSAQLKQPEFDATMNLLLGNDPNKALLAVEALEKKFPNDPQVFLLRGYYQFRDGNQNAAMMSFSNAIKADPKYAFAYGARAQLFSTKGMLDRAISDISEAIKLEPKNLDLLSKRSGFYADSKQYKEALEDMKVKINLEPNSIMNYFDAAVLSKSIDANSNADVFFEQAYSNKKIPKFVTDVLFGKFLLKYGRFEEAKIKYEAALATNEKDFGDEDFNDVAIVYYKIKNYDNAVLYSNKAIRMTSQNVSYHLNLAATYMELKNWQKVKETAQNALAVDNDSPMANMYMAIGLNFTGNQSQALEYQNKAKRLEAEQNK